MQQNQYLESKVLTASQPQLQLMLVEGALRFGRQALGAWQDPSQPPEKAERLLDKTIDVVEALTGGVSGSKSEISERLEEQYAYMFRELVACRFNRDTDKLDAVLKLLEYERETWKQACDLCQQGDAPSGRSVPVPHVANHSQVMSDRLSLEG